MAGEQLEAVSVTERGFCGDRAYALADTATRKVGSAKNVRKFGELLKCRAEFVAPPLPDGRVPAVRITLSDGTIVESGQPNFASILAAVFGPQIYLVATAETGLMLEFAAGTLAGKHAQTTEVPVAGAAPAGTLFDYACIHLVTTSSLKRLQAAYPEGQFTAERFRPNIVVDCADETGFVENSWTGHTLAVGPELVVRVSIPCPRCVMATLPCGDLPADSRILRTVAQLNRLTLGDFGDLPCVGVYADIVKAGDIRCGDPVRVMD